MKYIYVLSLVLFILLLSACQANEKPNRTNAKPLFINYEVRYLEQEKELRALASFKEGDSLEVAVPKEFSNTSFQGSAMDKQVLGERGFRYILSRKGPYSANLDFGYKNDDGIPVNYDLNMPEVGEFSIKEGTINKNTGATVMWKGEPLDDTQSLVLMFTDEKNKASSISVKGPTNLSEISLPLEALAKMASGNVQLYLVKKQILRTQEENQSILSVVEYYTSPIQIKVVE